MDKINNVDNPLRGRDKDRSPDVKVLCFVDPDILHKLPQNGHNYPSQ